MLEEIIIGPYLVVLNMVTVEIVGSAVFVVVFTYSYRRQDYHYLKFVSAKTPPSIVGRLFIECRDITPSGYAADPEANPGNGTQQHRNGC